MELKTKSIVDVVEIACNKSIKDIQEKELDNIRYLRVCKTDYNNILNVDFEELRLFKNLEELSIEGCMIGYDVLTILKDITGLKRLNFANCDFIDNPQVYFDNLFLDELVLNEVIGLDDIVFSNINKIIIINSKLSCSVNNVKIIDISRNTTLNTNLANLEISNLIISEKQLNEEYLNLPYTVTVKNGYDEIVRVINHD